MKMHLSSKIAVITLAGLCLMVLGVRFSSGQDQLPAEGDQAVAETPAAGVEEAPPERERTWGEAFILKLAEGGVVMIFLLLASIAGVAYTIERFVNLKGRSIVPDGLAENADNLWRQGKWRALCELPSEHNNTLARAISVVAKHRHSSITDVSTLASDTASRDLRDHLQKAYPLAIIATVAPLLGLLGTVIGMIGAFDKVAAAGALGDASLLGGDISKALITTGAGLTIAIPALALYHYFKSRTQQFGLELEEQMGELISSWYGSEIETQEEEE